MLNFKIVPVRHSLHTHGIQINEPGVYEGLVFAFGKIEFMGQDKLGNGRFRYDYDIITPAEGPLDSVKLEEEIAQILDKVLADSTIIADVEKREQEIVEAKKFASQFSDSPVMKQDDGTTIELIELPAEE